MVTHGHCAFRQISIREPYDESQSIHHVILSFSYCPSHSDWMLTINIVLNCKVAEDKQMTSQFHNTEKEMFASGCLSLSEIRRKHTTPNCISDFVTTNTAWLFFLWSVQTNIDISQSMCLKYITGDTHSSLNASPGDVHLWNVKYQIRTFWTYAVFPFREVSVYFLLSNTYFIS